MGPVLDRLAVVVKVDENPSPCRCREDPSEIYNEIAATALPLPMPAIPPTSSTNHLPPTPIPPTPTLAFNEARLIFSNA
ncbi:hypothetical protein V1478_000607 [Vespula squamosa]|uniref:Uncharacterized protein n=1 Tax=Vespula squamosa TaxID=30214 RepID=A0ABD2C5Y8_VESSQ